MKRLPVVLALLLLPRAAHAVPTARFDDVPVARPAPRTSPRERGAIPAAAPTHEPWARSAARERVRRGRELARRGESALALAEYTEALRLDPSFGEAYLGLGALREALGDLREAERVYDSAVRLTESRAAALERRARVRRALGDRDAAFRDLESSVALTPGRAGLETLAEWYVERRAWPAALSTWRRLLALIDDDSPERDRVRTRIQALSLLAAESDPVIAGEDAGWVRRALATIAKRAP